MLAANPAPQRSHVSLDSPIGPVATILHPPERPEVDRAGAGAYRALHRESADEVLRDLKERRLGGVLVSAARCAPADLAGAMRLVREFPRVPAIVLVSPHATLSPNGLLALGNCGLRQLDAVDRVVGVGRHRADGVTRIDVAQGDRQVHFGEVRRHSEIGRAHV